MFIDVKKIADEKFKQLPKIQKRLNIVKFCKEPSTEMYVKAQIKKCKELGIKSLVLDYTNIPVYEAQRRLKIIGNNSLPIEKFIFVKPYPPSFDLNELKEHFKMSEVEGLLNPTKFPCTANAILEIIKSVAGDVTGKNIVLINRSTVIGKPIINKLIDMNATLTVCHSKTIDLTFYTKNADIIITAVGKKDFIKKEMVKPNSLIIDVSITETNGEIHGDCEKGIEEICDVTPVPRGVGLLTNYFLFENLL